MKVYFEYGDEEGIIAYDRKAKTVMVSHPDTTLRKSLSDFLKEETTFRVPSFNGSGNMALTRKPVSSEQFMEMGLCQAGAILGIKLLWSHPGSVAPNYAKEADVNE